MKFIAIFVLGFCQLTWADACRLNKSEILFVSQGLVLTERSGQEGVCEDFGGDKAFSEKFKISVYVNFNIPGQINLDALDDALEQGLNSGWDVVTQEWMKKLKLVVVKSGWLKDAYGTSDSYAVNPAGEYLFISEEVVTENRFEEFMTRFYQGKAGLKAPTP